jgi:hypothetical protein
MAKLQSTCKSRKKVHLGGGAGGGKLLDNTEQGAVGSASESFERLSTSQ